MQEAEGNQSETIYMERRQATVAQWVVLHTLFDVCARKTGYEVGSRRRSCCGDNSQQKNNFGPPWKNRGKLKGGGGVVRRWACISTATGRERKSGWVIGMLGWSRATPRWANDLLWQSEMLGRRQGTPRW